MYSNLFDFITGGRSLAKKNVDVKHQRQKREITQEEKLYIGIILDGFDKFKNLSDNNETKSFGQVEKIDQPPTFKGREGVETFVFKPGNHLNIKVCTN